MINKIEFALIDRLKQGLGKMVYDVASYAGELDDERLAIRRLPVALVSYGGSQLRPIAMGVKGNCFQCRDTFVIIVLTRSLRSSIAGFHGGVADNEIGVNQLVYAVKYLLTNQTLNGLVKPLKPINVRCLWNNQQIISEKLSAYAIEFEAEYSESSKLHDGAYPIGSDDPLHPEYLFKHYQGRLDIADPDLKQVAGTLYDPPSQAQVDMSIRFQNKEHQ